MDFVRPVYLAAAIVAALGALGLLVAAVGALHHRDRDGADWPPLAWAAALVLQLIAFGRDAWVTAGVANAWTSLGLLVLIGLVAALATAALLVLPFGDRRASRSLGAHFAARGRWAPAALAAFNAIALLANQEIWSEGLLTESARLNLTLITVSAVGFLGRRARVAVAAALAYVAIIGWTLFEAWRLGY